MPPDNVETVRRLVEVYNERGIEAAGAEFFAEDVEFHEPPEQPGARQTRGRESTIRIFSEFATTWEEHRSAPEEIRAVSPDEVLLLGVEHLRGRDGIEVTHDSASIFKLKDGKIVLWRGFWGREDAIAAISSG